MVQWLLTMKWLGPDMVWRLPISQQKLRPLVEVDTRGGAPGVSCVRVHKQTIIKPWDHLRITMLKSSGKQQMEPDHLLGFLYRVNIHIYSCNGTIQCYNSSSPWHVMKSLQLNADSNGVDGEHFQEVCFKETSEQHSCLESCDGVYRSFTGCCNNLDNPEHGLIREFDDLNV